MLIDKGKKQHGWLIVINASEPERQAMLSMLQEVAAGQFIVLPSEQLDLVIDLIRAIK